MGMIDDRSVYAVTYSAEVTRKRIVPVSIVSTVVCSQYNYSVVTAGK